MQGIPVRAVITKMSVEFNSYDAESQGGDELIDQYAGEHARLERHDLIRTPQQKMNRIVDGFRDGNWFNNNLR